VLERGIVQIAGPISLVILLLFLLFEPEKPYNCLIFYSRHVGNYSAPKAIFTYNMGQNGGLMGFGLYHFVWCIGIMFPS
jgi:hypothetical protein